MDWAVLAGGAGDSGGWWAVFSNRDTETAGAKRAATTAEGRKNKMTKVTHKKEEKKKQRSRDSLYPPLSPSLQHFVPTFSHSALLIISS